MSKSIADKLNNLININKRDYCINSLMNKNHELISNLISDDENNAFIDDINGVIKLEINNQDKLSNIIKMKKNANNIYSDSGSWNLYICKYFIVGKIPKSEDIIFSPIILQRVKIEIKNNILMIYKFSEEKNIINEKIILFLKRSVNNNINIKDFINDNLNINDHKNILEMILNKNIEINENIKVSKENINDLLSSELKIVNAMMLGIYEPLGGKIKEDLEEILNLNIDPFSSSKPNGENFYINEENESSPIFQLDNSLNIFQRLAIRSSLKQDTVIHGPPGTGKSEVISNIILNIIIENKNTIIVSEKKAALDVLKERIGDISKLSIELYNEDSSIFYKKIISLFNDIGSDWISLNYKKNNFDISEYLKLNNNYKSLMKKHNNFLSLNKEISQINNFKKSSGDSLLLFLEKLNKFNLENYYIWKENNIYSKIVSEFKKFKGNNFLKNINVLYNFIIKNNINNNENYENLMHIYKTIKKNKITNYDDLNKNIISLDNFISKNKNHSIINCLKNNFSYIYDSYNKMSEIRHTYANIVPTNIQNIVDNNFLLIKDFMIIFDSSKDIDQKYIFDHFILNKEIISKRPSSAIFKINKLTSVDVKCIEMFREIINSNYFNLDSNIINSIELFNPFIINCYFNKELLNKMIEHNILDLEIPLVSISLLNEIGHLKIDDNKMKLYYDIATFIKKEPSILNMLNINFDKFVNDYIENDCKSIDKEIYKLYINYISSKLSVLNDDEKEIISNIKRISNLKRRPPLYKFIQEYEKFLRILFPIWISKPEHVSMFFPMKKNIFDYAIFDEASQMFLERSIPTIYRSTISIVAGDEKQLKPSSFFSARNNNEDEDYDIDDLDIAESLLERVNASNWNNFMLKNHYRSKRKELIEFSNKYIYNNELEFATFNGLKGSGIEVINCNGFFINGINEEEAKIVIENLIKNINNYNKILIITFNSQQSLYIEKMVHSLNNVDIIKKIQDELLVITNLENVQGNEGDLVIISNSYGPKDKDIKVKSNFGPLIMDGGSNRLNVAITRSKSKMIIIKSINSSDITLNNNSNLKIYRDFIYFCDSLTHDDSSSNLNNKFSIAFKEQIYLFILSFFKNSIFEIKRNVKIGSRKLDITILKNNEIILSLDLKEWNKYNDKSALIFDLDNIKFLSSRGYKIFIINEFEWYYNKNNILKKITNILKIKDIR